MKRDGTRNVPVKVGALVTRLGSEVVRISGPTNREMWTATSIAGAATGALIFCRYGDQRLDAALKSQATAVLVPADVEREYVPGGPTLIAVQNPRLAFARVVGWLFDRRPPPHVHATAIIDPTSNVAASASIGAYVVVGPRCTVGPGAHLGPHVVLEQDVCIGANTKIDAGTIIGAEGFGFERSTEGDLVNFPHLGGVRIGDNVEIGCNVCIDRGTLDDTIIGNGARIDNLTHISHNCWIGEHAVVVCQVSMCGSSKLGDYAWVSPSAAVLNQIAIGPRAFVGMGAVVIRDIADGDVVVGNPARPLPRK